MKIRDLAKLENISWKNWLRNLDLLRRIATLIFKRYSFLGQKNLGVKESSTRQVRGNILRIILGPGIV